MIPRRLIAIVLLSSSSILLAQQGAHPANPLTLDVVVNDKSGMPVPGLTQQDFTILDNKQPQKILSFEAVGQTASPANGPAIILLIDAVNTSFSKVAYARDQLNKFLQRENGKLAHPTSIAVLSDSGLTMQDAPSTDGNALMAYLDQHQTGLRTSRRSQGFYGAAERAELSLRSLTELAEVEARRPGRKIVIWISPGWALLTGPRVIIASQQQQGIFNSVVSLSAQLRQSRITLYSVDPLGSDASTFRTSYYREFLKGISGPSKAQFGDLALQVLAVQSGGRVFNSSNDVAGEIERSVRDANAYYVLSYVPPPADGPNEYHAINVQLARPDLKAQTRTGYYAQPPGPNH